MAYVDYKDILAQTNGGLTIITWFYPDAANGLERRNKKFKIREEKTASASIRKVKDVYKVTDFGGDQKERDAIGVCMLETGKSFHESCLYLAAHFKIQSQDVNWSPIKPIIEKRPLKENENAKDYNVELKDFTDKELQAIGPCVDASHCLDYNFHSVKSFTWCKTNEAVVTTSTEDYPIFTFKYEGWEKLYQPLSFEKQYRFRFFGSKPGRFIYGMELLKKQFLLNKKKVEEKYQSEDTKEKKDPRIERVFICSGGSDGLNLRSFGHIALWFNSESEQLNYEEYRSIMAKAQEIIYVADLDHTGLRVSIELGLKFLDIKLLMLPQWLKKFKDKRGNPCKDFKDYVVSTYSEKEHKKFTNSFNKLIENALPTEFWSIYYTGKQKKYNLRWTQLFNFLKLQGFGRYKDEHTKDGFHYIQIEGNLVKIVRPVDIEGFVHNFLKERQMPIELRDMVYSKSLSDRVLTKIETCEVDFTIADKNTQYMFFKNQVWEINKDKITQKKRGEIDRYVWEKKVIDKTVHLQEPQFRIFKDSHGNLDIEILNTENKFLNYLINTSRVYWRKDLEQSFQGNQSEQEAYQEKHKFNIAGPNLNEQEIYEQKLHLINKIYAFAYMLHTYKSPQRPWAIYAMDSKVADISESHGGSGKSVFLKSLQQILKVNHYINGRDNKKTQDDFIYHGVTEDTDFVLVDDCHQYMDYGFFFNAITGDMEVNNKNGLRFPISFDKSPKIGFASNYPPNNLDPSLERRLLFVVFSDYYHYNKDGEYNQTRTISDDFEGKTLFKEFTDSEWNDFFNFSAQAIQFFLSQKEKIDPPMGNVTKRNLLNEMGEAFKNWAEVFFASTESNESINLDCYVNKIGAFEDYKNKTGHSRTSPQKFKKSMKAYCKLKGWNYNPKGAGTNSDGRILRSENGQTVEKIYIQTKEKIEEESNDELFTNADTSSKGKDDDNWLGEEL